MRPSTLLTAGLAAAVPPARAVAQSSVDVPYHTHFFGDGMGFGAMMAFGPIVMILFLAAVVAVVVLLVRWLAGPGSGGRPPSDNALDILRERFARGEIDKEEFEDRRRSLSG